MIGENNFVLFDTSPFTSQTLLKHPIKLNNIDLTAIFDSGSTISIISSNVLSKLKTPPKVTKGPQIKLIDQSLVQLDKSVKLDIEVENEIYTHKFYVFEKLFYDVLLGLDFCRKSNVIINFNTEETFNWPESDYIDKEWKFDVRLNREYFLCKESVQKVKCNLTGNVGLGYFKPEKRFLEEYQLIIQETLIETEGTECSLLVFNPKNVNVIIFEDMKIGTIQPIVEIRHIEENLLLNNFEIPRKSITDKEFTIGTEDPIIKSKLLKLLETNRDIFGDSVKHLGKATNIEHEIKLTDDKPIKLRPYKHSFKEKEIIREQVKEMLEADVIEPSNSSYSFPVVLVKKKNGKMRFCIDYRKLNEITLKDRHPIPLVNDSISILSNNKYFSVMDLLSGYWNVYLKESDRPKTAFITPEGLYQFKVLAFGLTNAPATFQRYMQSVLADILYKFVVVYLDDIVIFSNSIEDHLKHIKIVFDRIREHNLKLQIEKCKFLCNEIHYLGHIINETEVRPDQEKTEAIREFPVPKKVKDVQSFLGLVGYYREFVEKFAFIANPLTNLLRKKVKFDWNDECQGAFDTLKNRLITAPILSQFREDCEIEIFTDSCYYGMGCILGQIQNERHVVISYNSKLFNSAQTNYTVTEKECLAIVFAVKKYRHYIFGKHFTIYSDHNPLQYLMKVKNPNGRLTRWSLLLMDYDFDIVYKAGNKHQNADTLSRYPFEPHGGDFEEFPVLLGETVDMVGEQAQDEWCQKIIEALKTGSKSKKYKRYVIEKNVLYRRTFDDNRTPRLLVCLPKKLRRPVLEELHDSATSGAHLGVLKTYVKVKSRFYWEKQEKSIRAYIRNCRSCQLNKIDSKPNKGHLQPITATEPFSIVGLDAFGPITQSKNRNKYIVILVDLTTKWLETKSVKNIRAETISRWFTDEILTRHGSINKVITDNGKNFCSKFMENVFLLTGTQHIKTTPYNPTANGTAEKACSTVKRMLKHYVDPSLSNWDILLPKVTFCYNISQHKSTKIAPFTLLYGREPKLPLDISYDLPRDFKFGIKYLKYFNEAKEMAKINAFDAQNEAKLLYDSNHQDEEFEVGQLVSLHTPYREVGLSTKLLSQIDGPYRIIKKLTPLVYVIRRLNPPRKTKKVNIKRLRRWYDEPIPELNDTHRLRRGETDSNDPMGRRETSAERDKENGEIYDIESEDEKKRLDHKT